ncbi:signal peptide peptidase SppA [Candidatus Woesearchaeota archaeon]|nr:signal peptide peptidase SppA [Candidatus Woesearchaeota archaeon]
MSRLKISILILLGLFVLSYLLATVYSSSGSKIGNVAKIKINGLILTEDASFWGEAVTSSNDFKEFIEEAETNPSVKAILIEINSPGGAPVASSEIADAIRMADKPTVAWIRESGTSGAYWAASAADKIVAHPLSITGSIGVIGSYLQFSGLLEKYNITYERLVSGEYKDTGSPLKELNYAERKYLEQALDEMHFYFIASVAQNRNMTFEDVEKLADGRFYTGIQAKNVGLVDELGGQDKAEELLKEMANLTDIKYAEYEKKKTFWDMLAGVMSQNSFFIGKGIGSNFVQQGVEVRT